MLFSKNIELIYDNLICLQNKFVYNKTTRNVNQYEINATWFTSVPVTSSLLIKRF